MTSCHFIEQKRNLVVGGPSGIGKTHITKATGHKVCRSGENVIFKKTSKLLQELMELPQSERAERLFRKCLKVQLLLFYFLLEAIDKISRYIEGLDYEAFSKNDMVKDAVMRNIEIIGEAANNIPALLLRFINRILIYG